MSTSLPRVLPQREAGLEHPARLGVVALALGQRRTDVQRKGLGDRRRLDRGHRQRRLHELAAFARVAAQDPEVLQRDGELDGDERIDAPASDRAMALRMLSCSTSTFHSQSACCGPVSPSRAALAIAK